MYSLIKPPKSTNVASSDIMQILLNIKYERYYDRRWTKRTMDRVNWYNFRQRV